MPCVGSLVPPIATKSPAGVPNFGAAVKATVGVAVWLLSLLWSAMCSRSALASDLASASMPVSAATGGPDWITVTAASSPP